MARGAWYAVTEDAWLFRDVLRSSAEDESSKWTPHEEAVRQWCLHELLRCYGVSVASISIEYPVKVGRGTHRADIVIRVESKPYIVVECKKRDWRKHDEAISQAISYASADGVNATYAVYTNGDTWWVRRRIGHSWVAAPDLPVFHDGQPGMDWREHLLALDRVGPVLHWLDETVPAKQAASYFGALQRFFHACNDITADADEHLLWAADHILRVLDDVTRHPNYTGGKFAKACEGLNRFWSARGVDSHFSGGDLWESVHSAQAEMASLVERSNDPAGVDAELLRVILALLQYLHGMNSGRKVKYSDVDGKIQGQIRRFLEVALAIRFNASLPDPLDRISVGDVRDFCRSAWETYIKESL